MGKLSGDAGGAARQALGLNGEALVLFQCFVVAAVGACCAAERADASRRIAWLRPRVSGADGLVRRVSDVSGGQPSNAPISDLH